MHSFNNLCDLLSIVFSYVVLHNVIAIVIGHIETCVIYQHFETRFLNMITYRVMCITNVHECTVVIIVSDKDYVESCLFHLANIHSSQSICSHVIHSAKLVITL
jgi:hypothetical protein